MLWPSDQLHIAFQQIKKSAHDLVSTLILVSSEADSICATRILTSLLQTESILYTIRSVRRFDDIVQILTPMLESQALSSVIFVNCGGSEDLTKVFKDKLDENVFFFVVDSRRPICHQNLLPSTDQVIVFGGEITDLSLLPRYGNREDIFNDDDDDSDEESTHSSQGEENDEPNQATTLVGQEEELPQTGVEDIKKEGIQSSSQNKDSPTKNQRKLDLKTSREALVNYYRQSWLGDPASHVLFTLAQQLGMDDQMSTWLAIVGVTSCYISSELDDETYAQFVAFYRHLVLDRNPTVKRFRPSTDDGSTNVPASSKDLIEFVPQELRLVMYRHWSLREACHNTPAFAKRFGCWSNDPLNKSEVEMFFASLGLSIRDASQKFRFMSRESKAALEKVTEISLETFKYDRITYPSFMLRNAFEKEISAEDFARCLQSCLEEGEDHDHNFAAGWDFVRNQKPQHFQFCLNRIKLQTNETIAVVQGQLVQFASVFRWAKIDIHEDEDDHEMNNKSRALMFSSPSGVCQLAKNIISANQAVGKWIGDHSKPLVLAVVRNEIALVAGLPCPSKPGEVLKNPFGRLFIKTAKSINIDFNPDEFLLSHVIQIASDDIQSFLVALNNVMVED